MSRWRVLTFVGVLAAAALIWTGISMAQERGGRWDPERMRQMMMERMQESLGAADEEWQVIGPRLEKVMTLSRRTRGGRAMGALFGGGRRGGPTRPDEGGPEQEQSAVEKAAEQLQSVLEGEAAEAARIKQALSAYRAAREEAHQELAKAQQELKEVLTVKQEAQLVLFGMLQ